MADDAAITWALDVDLYFDASAASIVNVTLGVTAFGDILKAILAHAVHHPRRGNPRPEIRYGIQQDAEGNVRVIMYPSRRHERVPRRRRT